MTVSKPEEISRLLREKKGVLFLAGSLCDEMELGSERLCDYVANLSSRINAPVAASGNVINGLRERGAKVSKKAAIQLVEMLRYEGWRDPIMGARPELLVFIGFPNDVVRALVYATQGADTMVLGTGAIEGATYCLADCSQFQLKKDLEKVIAGLS